MANRSLIAFGLALSGCVCASADESLERFSRSELHMGVEFEVVLYAQDAATGEAAIASAMKRIADLDKTLSDYQADSELSQLSATSIASKDRKVPFSPVRISDELWTVLAEAQVISRETNGAFDVTIGPLTKLWRRARRWKELPLEETLAAAQSSVGYQFLQLDQVERTAQLLHPDMRLDLGGIAKGYAADQGVLAAAMAGITRVLVRASGDIAAGDPPPNARGWRVGIAPLNPDDPPQRFVEIANCGISTSGDARQHLIVNGRRYSHIIDPRTGECVTGRSSVTVIAPRAMRADALATATSVIGPDNARTICDRFPGAEILMVHETESGEQQKIESPGFSRFAASKPN